jgi:proteasome alpha subunit
MPFYVSPEQLMKDRADFARKGIARGRSVVVVQYADGVLFVSENQSQALHKISEIYDRLAFAAVGRYNEFENLRIAGVRLADMRGYSYDRRDVTGRGLANAYAQTLGTIFSSGGEKPYEVEIFVAEVGDSADQDQIYRLTYDGSVADEHEYAVMGGSAEQVSSYLASHYKDGLDLVGALSLAVRALGHDDAEPRKLTVDQLEVALLDRTRTQPRKFRRISGDRLDTLFAQALPTPNDGTAAANGTAAADGTPASADGTPAEQSSAGLPTAAESPGDADPSDVVGDLPDDDAGSRDD